MLLTAIKIVTITKRLDEMHLLHGNSSPNLLEKGKWTYPLLIE
jgi:hypothetical protein